MELDAPFLKPIGAGLADFNQNKLSFVIIVRICLDLLVSVLFIML